MSTRQQVELEYIYVTIPAEYICVYHRILAMMADFGEEMLKDCKASCTDRNSSVIDCFNMFNAAVAARKLGKEPLARTLIKYIKAKINQIYRNRDNSTSFVFPVDETGQLKAFVSCGERPRFEINPDDMELYEHKFDNGFDEHFRLGPEDESDSNDSNSDDSSSPVEELGLVIDFTPEYHKLPDGTTHPCGDLHIWYDGESVDPNDCIVTYYFDDMPVIRWNDITDLTTGNHNFMVVVTYNDKGTKIVNKTKEYHAITD